MPWFKSDDSFYRHRKVRKLGKDRLPAVGLWQLAGTWCADNVDTNTADGFVPDEQVDTWDPRHRYAKRLVDVGLWERTEVDGEHGYVFHDWPDYQPTRATVEAEREAWRQRKERSRRKSRRDTDRDSQGESRESPNESHTAPVPVPVPVPTSGSVGEGESLDVPRANRPPDHCEQHPGGTNDPCRACADARRSAEQWNTQQQQHKARVAAELDRARSDPRNRCEHGTDGGTVPHPDTGKPLCALCRAAHQEAS